MKASEGESGEDTVADASEVGENTRKASEGESGEDTVADASEVGENTRPPPPHRRGWQAWRRLRVAILGPASGGSRKLTTLELGVILLAEGYSSLSVEILGLRRLVPYVGSTVLVTSIVLAAYLAALAVGYERGGRLAATGRDLRTMLCRRLGLAALLSAFWLSDFGVEVAFAVPEIIVDGFPQLLSTVLYAVFGIAPIGWLLAESILLAFGCAKTRKPSERAGNVFALSTVGNVAGSLLTAFVILNFLGMSAAMIVIIACLLVATAAAAPGTLGASTIFGGALALFGIALIMSYQLDIDEAIYIRRNVYADYQIGEDEETAGERWLAMNRLRMSIDTPDGVGYEYVEWLEDEICPMDGKSVLVLGAAGRTLGRGRECLPTITFVDIDAYQNDVADEFLYGEPSGELVIADAREYLRTTGKSWDFIIGDAFSHPSSSPVHLLSQEFFKLARASLTDNGTLYVNVITTLDDMHFRTRVDRTIRSIFAHCDTRWTDGDEATTWQDSLESTGTRLYRCPRSSLDGDRTIYTDEIGQVEIDRQLH